MARMPNVPEDHVEPARPSRANDYDGLAEVHAAENDTGLANAYYERPAILAVVGKVTGRRILDAGCGSGPLFVELRNQGAVVTGIDNSAGLLELARRRLGDGAQLQVADLRSPLPFADGAFDDRTSRLIFDTGGDAPPAAPRRQHDPVIPRGRESVIDCNPDTQLAVISSSIRLRSVAPMRDG